MLFLILFLVAPECTLKTILLCSDNAVAFSVTLGDSIVSIFIPTTHGTGSEVTMWGTIWDMKNKIKYSI